MIEDDKLIKATLTVNPNDFLECLNITLEECSNSVFIGLSSLENLSNLPESIPGEDDFYSHSPFGRNYSLEARKDAHRKWLLRKGFEDLIKGVTTLLVEVLNFYDFQELAKEIKTFGEFQKLFTQPYIKNTKKHLPELLELVNSKLKSKLTFEDEIDSINTVRNCLVHRNGFVSPHELKGNKVLILKWQYPKIVATVDSKETEFHKYIVLNEHTSVDIQMEQRSKEFKLNDEIEISYQLFNELIFTCHFFGTDLISKL